MGSQKRCYEASVVVPLTVLAHWEAVDGRATDRGRQAVCR